MFASAHEAPLPVATFVGVLVSHRDDEPTVPVFVLCPTEHRTDGVIGVEEIELMTANQVDAAVEATEDHVIPGLQRFSPTAMPASIDVIDKEVDQRVEVSRVERQGVPRRQLPDRCSRFQKIQPVFDRATHLHDITQTTRITVL